MTTGELIKELRNKKGLTQKQLQEMTGINEADIRKIENNRRNPRDATLKKIADALEVDYKRLKYAEYDDMTMGSLHELLEYLDLPWLKDQGPTPSDDVKEILDKVSDVVKETATKEINRRQSGLMDALEDFDIVINGTSVSFDGSTYELTSEQLEQLPDMSIEQIKALIRSLAKSNKRD